MSEAKFTKGPWISGMHDISDAEGYNVECEVDCGWSYIGTSKKCVAMAVTMSHLDEELDANTALIAVAPEMYSILKDAMVKLSSGDYEGKLIADDIKTLLAKARGEK